LRLLALRDVGVRLQDHGLELALALMERPPAGHHDPASVTPPMDELALPPTPVTQLGHDLLERAGEVGAQDDVGDAAHRLLPGPPIELLGGPVPEEDGAAELPDQDGLLRRVQQRSLLPDREQLPLERLGQ